MTGRYNRDYSYDWNDGGRNLGRSMNRLPGASGDLPDTLARFARRRGIAEVDFGINDLEMVAQIFPRWNRVADWLREPEGYSRAA